MGRREARHGVPTEDLFWAAQAVAGAGLVHVAGQIARAQDGSPAAHLDLCSQFEVAAGNLDAILRQLGGTVDDVLFARVYLADGVDPADPIVHRLVRTTLPSAAGVLVSSESFIAPEYLVEISAVAVDVTARLGRREAVASLRHDALGLSESVRVGSFVFVSGVDAGGPALGPVSGGLLEQLERALAALAAALGRAGAAMADVVSTQILVTRLPTAGELEPFATVHRDAFHGPTRPTSSLIGVRALSRPGALVELTAIAIVEAAA